MSMISAQIDELRELAGDSSMEWVTGPIRASVLRDAADTIWQLRDDLQRTNAGNANLREQGARLFDKTLELGTENSKLRELCKLCEREAENSKLRKLVLDWRDFAVGGADSLTDWNHKQADLEQRMRDLGMEDE